VPNFSILEGLASEVAPRLLGCYLERDYGDQKALVKIVETEAYDQTDAASHSYRGQTPRTEIMFGDPGFLYVYFTYGMHYCCNVVVGPKGHGSAVLIRAVEPIHGEALMKARRPEKISGVDVSNGPAKLCQALAIDKQLNGHDLTKTPLTLIINEPVAQTDIIQTTRIGISQATDVPWRFYLKNNPYVSKVV
jgi:DNA-3-methyladenine glycosylase